MFTRAFHPDRFLRSVFATEPFAEYCQRRRIQFAHGTDRSPSAADARRWLAAIARLSPRTRARVELELATIDEMSGREAVTHLFEVAEPGTLPPDTVPGGAPVALWFFLHQRQLFREVFFHHEMALVDSWRFAQATTGLRIRDLERAKERLASELREFFRLHEGTGRFCSVDAHRLGEAVCVVAQVADRLQFLEAFTDRGRPTRQRLRPAVALFFVYHPRDGTVRLKAPVRSRDRTQDLFRRFGSAILGTSVEYDKATFALDRLKRPFHPQPDAEDMELVRVKALHLRYPEREGHRLLKLETLSADAPAALDELLRRHSGGLLGGLRVSYAEVQVRLVTDGRRRNHLIRIWPDRCNLGHTRLGERLRVNLRRWGLLHAW